MGLKGMGRSFTFSLFGGASGKESSVGILSLVQSDAKTDSSWVVMFDFHHCGLHGYIEDCIYGCIDGGITGGNSSTELFHFLLGLKETRLQGVEASFLVLGYGYGP